MAYATEANMIERFGETEILELTDRDKDSEVDSAVLDGALSDADALIDGYLAARYTLPLASVPSLLIGPACDIARFKLWDDRAPDEVRKRYDDALALLKLISNGTVVLPPDAQGEKPAASASMDFYCQTRVFTEETLADF